MEANRFLGACRGEPVDTTPIWLMRQAGRYLPEYMAVRGKTTFLGLCKTPDLAAEVTLQPLRRFDLDAGIIFSDILIPVEAMGMDLQFDDGEGPRLGNPIRTSGDVERLRVPDPKEAMGHVLDAIHIVCREKPASVPLIGFAGAPFTLASYMIEGQGSRSFEKTKVLMYTEPKLWRALGEKIARTVAGHLLAQIEAGCQAVQIFDSWAGHLSPNDFLTFALPYIVEIVDRVRGGAPAVPIILFAKGVHACLPELAKTGADALGVDWTTPLDQARRAAGDSVSLQGNLDPAVLLAPVERIEREAQRILNEAIGARGHIFNLGHGILKTTPPDHVAALVDAVHREGRRRVPADLA